MKKFLFGSTDPLKNKEPSTSRVKPISPTTSVSESNNITQSADYEPSISSSLNLNFQGLKFEVDPDEVQSPNSALWESLFGDQTDSCTDFMISSPKKTPDFMIYSPKRNTDSIISSPPRRSPFGHAQGPSPLGSPSAAYSTVQKGKGQSPLHKVFPSTSEFGNVAGDGLGAYLTMKMTTGVGSPISECFNVPMTSATTSNYAAPINQDKDIYQMNSFATLPLQQQQQDHSLLGLLSTESEQDNKDSGLELVHLLLACAEAVAKEDYMEARRYMHHLNSIVSPLGDSMQRVACCFTDALSARLAATLTITPNMISTPKPLPSSPLQQLNIYQILYQACPYIKFAHFTCNQAIFEAFEAEERVHIIDLDILQGYQWPAFMQALSSRYNGPPFLRITGVGYPAEAVRETGRCLAELADSLRIPFEFHSLGEQLEDLKPQMFQRRVGEALAVNSVNRLHRVPANQQGALLQMIRDQAPNIVTLVEQDASHNGPYFLGRFLEALHYYSAIFDSLDSTFTVDSVERAKVEQYIFALEIRNIVACEGAERVERHERLEKWKKLMEGAGFHGVPLSPNAVTQSEILLGLYACDSYRLTQDRGCLLLGWQDRVLMSASAWRC